MPVSRGVFVVVARVQGEGGVSSSTKVAVQLGGAPTVANVAPELAACARAKWMAEEFCRVKEFVAELDACVRQRARVIALAGLEKDAADVIDVYEGAAPVVRVDGREKLGKVGDALIAARQTTPPGVVVCAAEGGVDTAVVALLLNSAVGEKPMGWHEAEGGDETIVIFTCEEVANLPPAVLTRVEAEVIVPAVTEGERMQAVSQAVQEDAAETDIEEIARMSTGFARAEVAGLASVYVDSGIKSCREAVKLFGKGKLTVDVGGVKWGDIGGLSAPKEEILELVDLSSDPTKEHSDGDVVVNTNRRVGVLLYGPPGTGKTLLARAVAGECGCSFISVKGPELLDMYVGESEKNVREVFARAATAAPCVVFFDELDALAPARGRGADSGGVSDRVVSQLLSEFDVIASRSDVFIIAASNRPDLVDPGLLRPGRLDKMIYVSMPGSRKEQEAILKAQTRKFQLKGEIDFEEVLENAPPPPTLSGADLYSLAAGAWMHAAKELVGSELDDKETTADVSNSVEDDPVELAVKEAADWAERQEVRREWFSEAEADSHTNGYAEEQNSFGNQSGVQVSQLDFVAAAKELKPSLNSKQLQEYEELRVRIETGV